MPATWHCLACLASRDLDWCGGSEFLVVRGREDVPRWDGGQEAAHGRQEHDVVGKENKGLV